MNQRVVVAIIEFGMRNHVPVLGWEVAEFPLFDSEIRFATLSLRLQFLWLSHKDLGLGLALLQRFALFAPAELESSNLDATEGEDGRFLHVEAVSIDYNEGEGGRGSDDAEGVGEDSERSSRFIGRLPCVVSWSQGVSAGRSVSSC
ncbi:hypothetical protein NMY22_g10517 [Coprinellus aureogranulatus]|nr:hypothetical protein NMY22_g10517 [Coprinellus aureogranulatus]